MPLKPGVRPIRPAKIKSLQDFEKQLDRIRQIIVDKVPKSLFGDRNQVYVGLRNAATKGYRSTVQAATSAHEAGFRAANSATAHVRDRVVPAVKPYTDAASRQLDPHLEPARAAYAKHVHPHYRHYERHFDSSLQHTSKLQVALSAAVIAVLALLLVRVLVRWLTAKPSATIFERSTRAFRSLPGIKLRVEKAQREAVESIQKSMRKNDPAVESLQELPPGGLDVESVMQELEDRAQNDFRYADGESKATGTIYISGDSHRDLLNDAYCMFSQVNPLHADLFPSVRRMEAEVVAMTASLLGGGVNGVSTVSGAMTSGGSESIVSAIFTSLAFMKQRRGVREPEIIIGNTAHAAYWKAAKYANARLVIVPVEQKTQRLTAASVRPFLSAATAVVVASAVSYPHGALDDVMGLGALCKARKVCLHVDACLGGFVLPFLKRLGYQHLHEPLPPFDFAVEGVTSMSVDTHKYGQAHKGTSVVLYRDAELRHAQFTAVTDWSGGLYVSPGLSGSRSGGLIATAWAALRTNGHQGFQDATRAIMRAVTTFKKAVQGISELEVLGEPVSTVIAFKSSKHGFNIHALGEVLSEKGWSYGFLIKPAALHFCFTLQHVSGVDGMIKDLKSACEQLRKQGENGKRSKGSAGGDKARLYGAANIPANADTIADVLLQYQDIMLTP